MLAKSMAHGIVMLAATLALAGCQSAGIDDLAPSAAIAEPVAAAAEPLAEAIAVPVPSAAPRAAAGPVALVAAQPEPALRQEASSAPKNTGAFPKIGQIPVGETAQLGAGGAAALRSDLSTARAAQSANADAPESYAEKLRRLRLLQARHAAEVLAEIEAKKPQ